MVGRMYCMIGTLQIYSTFCVSVHVVYGSKEDFVDVTSTILHVLVNVYETLDITFMALAVGT